jgi:hypothetical protein
MPGRSERWFRRGDTVRLWRRETKADHGHINFPAVAEREMYLVAAPEVRKGVLRCSARGCAASTGLNCAHKDDWDALCPTAWCPEHRLVVGENVLCPVHAAAAVGAEVPVDESGPAPILMRWVVDQIGDDMSVLVGGIALEKGERLVTEPVHCIGSGLPSATWKHVWQAGSQQPSPLQVSVSIDEAAPMIVHARVNGKPVISIPVPWSPDHGVGIPSTSTAKLDADITAFRIRFCAAIDWVIEEWCRVDSSRRADLAGFAAERRERIAS